MPANVIFGGLVLLLMVAMFAVFLVWIFGPSTGDTEAQLARTAPEVLRGKPLLDTVIEQGRELEAARLLLSDLTHSNEVFLPTAMSDRIAQWQQQREEHRGS